MFCLRCNKELPITNLWASKGLPESPTQVSAAALGERLKKLQYSYMHSSRQTQNGKPVYWTDSAVFNANSGFVHKKLSSGPTFNCGTACAYACRYCYVETMVMKQQPVRKVLRESRRPFDRLVIRRRNPLRSIVLALTRSAKKHSSAQPARDLLPERLLQHPDLAGRPRLLDRVGKYCGPDYAGKVVFGSPLVDVAATAELANETVDVCELILRLSDYDIRLLSKSPNLAYIVAAQLRSRLPETAVRRVLFGLSIGTLENDLAAAIEPVPPPSERLKALRWLQQKGFRTYGMLCPILPQKDPEHYASRAMELIQAEQCETIWAEPVNFRAGSAATSTGDDEAMRNSFEATLRGLRKKDKAAAERFEAVALDGDTWEQYCRGTFEALLRFCPKHPDGHTKLVWMQYPRNFGNVPYWLNFEGQGAVVLGGIASNFRVEPYRIGISDIDAQALMAQLKSGSNPAVDRVWRSLPLALRDKISAWRSRGPVRPAQVRMIVSALNAIVRKPLKMKEGRQRSFFDLNAFTGIKLSDQSAAMVGRETTLSPLELVQLNRLLLQDVFPQAIRLSADQG